MPVNLVNGLRAHYDCDEASGSLLSNRTFPAGAPITDFVVDGTPGAVTPGKFGDARGPLTGTVGVGDGFTRILTTGDPWDYRGGTQSFSVGCWVYLDGIAGDQILFEYSGTAENQRAWALRAVTQFGGGTTAPAIFFRNNDVPHWLSSVTIPAAGIAGGQATAEWVYIGATFNSSTKFISFFYGSPTDGTHYRTDDFSSVNSGNGPFDGWTSLAYFQTIGENCGATNSVGSTGLDGDLDHLDVWDRVLSEAEFLYAYNSGNGRAISAYIESSDGTTETAVLRQIIKSKRKKYRGKA